MRAALPLLFVVAVAGGCDDPPGSSTADDGGVSGADASLADVTPLPLPDAGPDADASVPPPPLDSEIVAFCAQLGESLCGAVERCGCATSAEDTCRMSFRSQCELDLFGPEVRFALADGRLVYDGDAAARMVSALDDASVCAARTIEPWTIRDYYTFGGILEGTRRAGDACTPLADTTGYGYVRYFRIDECAAGVCDAGRCVGFSGVGGACEADHFCADLEMPVEFGWDVREMSLPCERPTPESPTGICTVRRAAGATCARSSECESNRCDMGRCVALGGVGDACMYPQSCESGFCAPVMRQCAAGNLPVGAACSYYGYECASGACTWTTDGQLCMAAVCSFASYYNLQGLLPRQ